MAGELIYIPNLQATRYSVYHERSRTRITMSLDGFIVGPDISKEDPMGITDGIQSALDQAKAVADHKNIWVTGANVSQQYIRSGHIDELHIHIALVLLTKGTRLFENIGDTPIELENISCIQTQSATHLMFSVKIRA